MTEQIIAFAVREADMSPITIVCDDQCLTFRDRLPTDEINDAHVIEFGDLWTHVQSLKQYERLNTVFDGAKVTPFFLYRSLNNKELWVRPRSEWFEVIDGRWRYELSQSFSRKLERTFA